MTATWHILLKLSFADVKATIDPVRSLFDCSQFTFLPERLNEKVTLAAIPALAKVKPVMKT